MYGDAYPLFCWLTDKFNNTKKYVIRGTTMKKLAKRETFFNNELMKCPFLICPETKVISIKQCIEHIGEVKEQYVGNIKMKKIYCTLSETLSGYPLSGKESCISQTSILIAKCMQYIIGAQINEQKYFIVTDQKGPILGIGCNIPKKSFITLNEHAKTPKFSEFLSWLNSYIDNEVENSIFIRARTILTKCDY
jgi:hypothetical protein